MKFRPNWKLTLFYLLLFPLLVGLGFWQLYRADYKQTLQDLYDQRATAMPVSLSELALDKNAAYLPVELEGRFDNNHNFLLDNRVFKGRAGYEVISAFQLESSVMLVSGQIVEQVWVNRGWVAMTGDRNRLPEVRAVTGVQQITGQLIIPADSFVLAEVPLTGLWPEVIQAIDLPMMSRQLNVRQSLPYLLRLKAGEAGSFQVSWQPVNTTPQKSLGYAIQWFLMALVLTGLFVWAAIKQDKRGHA